MPYVDPSVIANIFRSLRGRFGNAFVDKYRSGKSVPAGQPNAGKDTGLLEAMDVWGHELRELSAKDIEHGLSCKFKYPPSADEFVQACCTREVTPPAPIPGQKALAAPTITRDEAAKRLSAIGATVKTMDMGAGGKLNLKWAYAIADDIASGRRAASLPAQMAADALYENNRTVPEALVPFLSARYREQAA